MLNVQGFRFYSPTGKCCDMESHEKKCQCESDLLTECSVLYIYIYISIKKVKHFMTVVESEANTQLNIL